MDTRYCAPPAPFSLPDTDEAPARYSFKQWREQRERKRTDWERQNVRTVRAKPSDTRANAAPKQTPPTATISPAAPFDFDPYGWAFLFWVTGLVVWFRHPQFFTHWVVFAAVVFLIAPAKYLIRAALLIGVGWFLLHKYQIL